MLTEKQGVIVSSRLCLCEYVHVSIFVCVCLSVSISSCCELKPGLNAVLWPVFKLQMIEFVLNSSEINATLTPFTCEAV